MNFDRFIVRPVSWAVILGGVALSGCSSDGNNRRGAGEEANPAVVMEGYSYDAIATLPDSLATPVEGGSNVRVSGQGMLPVSIGDADISSLRDSLQNLARVIIIDRGDSEPRLEPGWSLTDVAPDDSVACSNVVNRLSVSLMTPRMVVWKNYCYAYPCRAAHGTYNTTYVNYSITKRKILSLSDIFSQGYEKELEEMLRERLKDNATDLITPIEEIGIPNDFEVTENGIDFIYGLYEIAPYSSGEITVNFDSYELEDLLAPGMAEDIFGSTY